MQMRTPYLSKGFHLLGIALLSLSLIALGVSIFVGLPKPAVVASVNQSNEHGDTTQNRRSRGESRKEPTREQSTPLELTNEVFEGAGKAGAGEADASEVGAVAQIESTDPESTDSGGTANVGKSNAGSIAVENGKSNSPSEQDGELSDLSETPDQSGEEASLPILPANPTDSGIKATHQATPPDMKPGDGRGVELAMQANTSKTAEGSDPSSAAQITFSLQSGDGDPESQQSVVRSQDSDSFALPTDDGQRETKSFTLARLNFDRSPFRYAINGTPNASGDSFSLVSDTLRQQTLDTEDGADQPLPYASETPAPGLFSPVVVMGLPPRMQSTTPGDFSNSELITKQASSDVEAPSFSDRAPPSALNQSAEELAELPADLPSISENEPSPSSYALIDGGESKYEPLVSRPVEGSSSRTTASSGNPQPRLAMLQTPSPSSPPPPPPSSSKSNPATEPKSETSESTTPTPTPNKEAEDDGEHMLSELAGSCHGCFSRLFDSGLYASNEFTFLSTSSIGEVRVGITDTLSETTISESSKSAVGFGNRTTLGIRGAFAGLRATYWTFGANQEITDYGDTSQAIPKFVSASGVDAETVDLEITQPFCIFGCRFESSVGARYADYRANDAVLLVDQMHNSLELTGIAKASRQITGAGPTLALAGRKNLRIGFGGLPGGEFLPDFECSECGSSSCMGECDTWRSCHGCFPWNIYWNGRISWLWADESSAALTEASVFQHDGNSNIASARSRDKAAITDDSDSSIYTLSFQIGLEYCRPILCRSQLVIRAGFEYQHWDLGKNVAESQSFAFLTDNSNFGGRVDSIAQSQKNYVDLTGFTLMLGLNY